MWSHHIVQWYKSGKREIERLGWKVDMKLYAAREGCGITGIDGKVEATGMEQ